MEMLQPVHFSVAIIIHDMEIQSTSIPVNAKGQGHLMTWDKPHSQLNIF